MYWYLAIDVSQDLLKTNLLIIHCYRYETKEQYILIAILADNGEFFFDFLAFETMDAEAFKYFWGFPLCD